jgi:hypothetical protein
MGDVPKSSAKNGQRCEAGHPTVFALVIEYGETSGLIMV